MKIEAVGGEYQNMTLNVNNQKVVFKNNIADVSDDLGKMMIEEFPHFFPKGKVVLEKNDKEPHVFDETKYLEQHDKIVSLKNSLKAKDQHIKELIAELAHWKELYQEVQQKFLLVTEKTVESNVVVSDDVKKNEQKEEDIFRKQLEEKNIEELKVIANELKVPIENVKKKSAKKAWIDAILEQTFK